MAITTLFDRNYLPHGGVLMRSIRRSEPPDTDIVVLPMDVETLEYCQDVQVGDPRLHIVTLAMLCAHYQGLADALANRSRAEQCFSLTAFLCSWVVHRFGVAEYIDADCVVMGQLEGVRNEIGDAPVGITPHRWTPKYIERLRANGVYNVGYVYFRRSPLAADCLRSWRAAVLGWQRPADGGTFEDQTYLDVWPERFGAHAILHLGCNLAPWNQEQYSYELGEDGVWVQFATPTGQQVTCPDPLVLYHFHETRVKRSPQGLDITHTRYPVFWLLRKTIYQAYDQELCYVCSLMG